MTFAGFANALGLLGLLGLPVVLALHLLRERSKQFTVSSLSLWSFLDLEVRGSQPRRIPISWLLVLDLLIVLLLALAWAQPKFNIVAPVQGARQVIILLDVSTSMRAQDTLPDRISQAKLKAAALLGSLGPRDKATVVTFSNQAIWLGDTREQGLQELVASINALQVGAAGYEAFNSALALAAAAADRDLPIELHILTDGAFPEPELAAFSGMVHWHLFGSGASNQAVVEISADRTSDQSTQVFARLANFGDQPASRIISLVVDGELVDSSTLYLGPDSTRSQVWQVTGKPKLITVQLTGSDRLQEDDSASIGVHVTDRVSVGLITDEPYPLEQAILASPGVDLRVMTPQQYLPGLPFDIVFFRGMVPEVWPVGTVVLIEPPPGLFVTTLQEVTAPATSNGDPLLSDIDFDGVRWSQAWELTELPEGFVPLLQAGERPLLVRGFRGPSDIFLFLADLHHGNLTRHPAFPVLVAAWIQSAAESRLPTSLTLGETLPLPDQAKYPSARLTTPQGKELNLAGADPDGRVEFSEPGVYFLDLLDTTGSQEQIAFGVNAGTWIESDIRQKDWAPGQGSGSETTQTSVRAQREVNLMPWLLGAAMLVLILEAVLAWR
jgi:Ca-activated chloride channel homolog